MNTHVVYGIIDPKDGQVIYVGYSSQYKNRKKSHISNLRAGRHNNKQLQSVYNKRPGLSFVVLLQGSENTAKAAEVGYIAEYKRIAGDRLCNVLELGEFANGFGCISEEERLRRLSAKNKKRWDALHEAMEQVVTCCKVVRNELENGKTPEDRLINYIFRRTRPPVYEDVAHIRAAHLRRLKNPRII